MILPLLPSWIGFLWFFMSEQVVPVGEGRLGPHGISLWIKHALPIIACWGVDSARSFESRRVEVKLSQLWVAPGLFQGFKGIWWMGAWHSRASADLGVTTDTWGILSRVRTRFQPRWFHLDSFGTSRCFLHHGCHGWCSMEITSGLQESYTVMRFDPTRLLHCTHVESKMFDDRIY